ncbi:MAG: tyrosine-type recombinase/integrase [Lachnospiraceae bacterium]|nr:tyrosine-type recombinase/integrase [Lachnospiraceae bacterium]
MKTKTFQYYVSRFFTAYLSGERGLSSNTISSYRDTFRQLLAYYSDELKIQVDKIQLCDLTAVNVKGFLDHIETQGCSASTRNQRLASIKSFIRYVQLESPENLENSFQIMAIRSKRQSKPIIEYLSQEQLSRLLAKPISSTKNGFKDMLILTLLYDSGARVSEFINIKVSDIRMDMPAVIRLHGKGNKSRWVPLDSRTVKLLDLFMEKELLKTPIGLNRYLFLNRSGNPYTRAGISYILLKYTNQLYAEDELSFPKKLSPHCLRHTKAMILLQAGTNLIYIRDVLGHEHMRTTEVYARADGRQKRAALEAAQSQIKTPDASTIEYQEDQDLLAWLNNLCKS